MTKQRAKPLPDGVHTVTPHLVCAGAADAIEFYKKAFNAVELIRLSGPQGKLAHAHRGGHGRGQQPVGADKMTAVFDAFSEAGVLPEMPLRLRFRHMLHHLLGTDQA